MSGARLKSMVGGATTVVLLAVTAPAFAEIQEEASPRMVQATRTVWTPADRVYLTQSSKSVDRAIIREIQKLLAVHGLDPGPADGSLGPKTNSAIIRYQKSAGIVTDGRPSHELLDHLRNPPGDTDSGATETNEAAPVGEVEPAQTTTDPPPQPAAPSLRDTVWNFKDDTGSRFTLIFAAGGKVDGVLYDRFWSWQQAGDDVTIAYDNGMGRRVKRLGTLTGLDTMTGTANATRGDDWTWTAERVREAEESSNSPD